MCPGDFAYSFPMRRSPFNRKITGTHYRLTLLGFTRRLWRKLRLCIILIALATISASCHHYGIALVSRDIVLTLENPTNSDFRLRLLSIAQDGRTAVEFPVLNGTAKYEAIPGERFRSETAGQRAAQLL